MILKILRSGILILMVANLVSCATILHGKNVKMIPISGTPSGAKVYLGNKVLGTTPFNYTPPETKKQELKIVKDGYKDHIATIQTKLNPLWTGVSIVGGALGLFIPTIIDFSKGSVKDIKTDRIEYTLDSVFKGVTKTGTAVVATIPFSRSSSEKKIVVSSDSVIYNPALRVRTYSRELTLSFRSTVSVKTKNGRMIRTNIKKVDTEGVTLAKNSTKIYYSDFKKVRIYHARRWFPWLTLPTIIGPIWWHASSKVIESDARKCKRQVVDLRVINHFNKYQFGKVKCYKRSQ